MAEGKKDRKDARVLLRKIYNKIQDYTKGPPWYELSAQAKSFIKNEVSKLMDKAQKVSAYKAFCRDKDEHDAKGDDQ